ncbi:Hypothetical predicted protein [Cloeon dipterum]|nr:Hypothetical predicted protein [Cloeon dipterum]
MEVEKSRRNIYPTHEPDDVKRTGQVFIVRRGVPLGISSTNFYSSSDSENPFQHWAIAVKFIDGKWVRIEGFNIHGRLRAGYRCSSSKPKGTIINVEDTPVSGIVTFRVWILNFLSLQWLKASLYRPVRFIMASPRDLHKLAASIPINLPFYCLQLNDCQTWFLRAMYELQKYEKVI